MFKHVDLLFTLLVIVRCAWIFAAPLRAADLPLRFAQDDFYYYLKPAQNLAWFHRSTFDGTVITNGYHPLYFALLTGLSFFVHSLRGMFKALWVVDMLSAVAIFILARRMFERATGALLSNALAISVTVLCIPLICDQMEVTLALPLGFAFLCVGFVPGPSFTVGRCFLLGVLGALTFLARLDAGIMVFLFAVAMLLTREYRQTLTPKKVLAFLGGVIPLPAIYFVLNLHYFHTLLPVSGMAKQLRHGHTPSLLLPLSFNGASEFLLNVTIAASIMAWAFRRYLKSQDRVLLFAVLVVPFLFYGLEMLVSDWPIWNWYFYDLRFSAAGACLLTAHLASRVLGSSRFAGLGKSLSSGAAGGALAVAACLVICMQRYKIDHWMVEIQHAAGLLDGFERAHPGKYAMGDRAGMFGITSPSPVLQTEGLVMDRVYLEHVRSQDDLRSVLASYGVNYYVAFVFKTNLRWQATNNCLHAMEPSIAGASSLRMRSDFCGTPLFRFPGFDGEYFVYPVKPI